MNEADQYRANAAECRRMAEIAPNESDKQAWLDMAKSWSFLTMCRASIGELPHAAEGELGTKLFNQFAAIVPTPFLGLARPTAPLTGFLVRIIHRIARNLQSIRRARA